MKRFGLFLFTLWLTQSVMAATADDLSAKLKQIQTFSADFAQVLSDPKGEALQTTEGHVTVKAPGLFRWQVKPPYEQLVVANQQFLWVYDPDLEQVTLSDRSKMDNSPAQILTGDFSSLGSDYQVTMKKAGKASAYTLVASNKQQSAFAQLMFEFDGSDQLQSMTLVDKLDQTTRVTFSKREFNKPVADTLFQFDTPEGVDVIVNE